MPTPATAESRPGTEAPVFSVDTVAGSVLHTLIRYPSERIGIVSLYLIALSCTLLPLLASLPFSTGTSDLSANSQRLSLLQDWNILFALVFTFPCVFILLLTDQDALARALETVQRDGTVVFADGQAQTLAVTWRRRFLLTNIVGQLVGLAVGAAVAFVNHVIYTPESVGYWIAEQGRLLPVGVVYLLCIGLLYTLVTHYIFRIVAISLLFRDMVFHARLRLLPMHPDRSGGLLPVGRLGLRNQYVLMLLGINIVLLVGVTYVFLQPPDSLYALIALSVVAYLVLGPLVFMAPLLPFRGGMRKTKAELMSEVAQRLRVELQRLRAELRSGTITKEDEELIDRLRKVAAVIDELPVWPFDASTFRKFLAAYVIPILSAVGYPLLKMGLDFISDSLA